MPQQNDTRRGDLFDAAALDYDSYRPGYPAVVICEVASLSHLKSSSRLLEVGCGTGNATVPFASRGYMIDCVDPGRRLVAFARRSCAAWPNVSFKVGRFEDVRLPARSYDLIYSAQAFHWVDPRLRLARAAELLTDGGSLALLYNYPGRRKNAVLQSLMDAVTEESGGKMAAWDYTEQVADWKKEIAGCGLFRNVRLRRHQWIHRYNAEGYAGLFRTYSDFLSLPGSTRQRVLSRMRNIITANGGCVSRSYDCVMIHAEKA
jgi:SAM-dependent methyltransferase